MSLRHGLVATSGPAPADTPSDSPVGLTVWLLHTWNRPSDTNDDTNNGGTNRDTGGESVELYFSHAAALHALAQSIRDNTSGWTAHRADPDLRDSSDDLSDAQAVALYYDIDTGTGTDTGAVSVAGAQGDAGFELVEHRVFGPEPTQLALRLATLRVLDEDPDNPHDRPLTYCLDAVGLTITAQGSPTGPVVHITATTLPPGTPIAVHLHDPHTPVVRPHRSR